MNILILDPENSDIKILINALNKLGTAKNSVFFTHPEDALSYMVTSKVDLLFTETDMTGISGIELVHIAKRLNPDVLIVFITSNDRLLREFNELGGDYYYLKPYTEAKVSKMTDKLLRLLPDYKTELSVSAKTGLSIQCNGKSIPISGKSLEILNLLLKANGESIKNEDIYMSVWNTRYHDHESMKTYFNALRRLKKVLHEFNMDDLLISGTREQRINTDEYNISFV